MESNRFEFKRELTDGFEREALELEQATTVKMTVKTTVKTPDLILQILRGSPNMTLVEVATAISKSLRAVERASSKLVKEGRLKRIGSPKSGHWEVTENGHE